MFLRGLRQGFMLGLTRICSDGRPSVAKPGLPEGPLQGAAGALPTARFGCALADGPARRLSVVPELSTAQLIFQAVRDHGTAMQ